MMQHQPVTHSPQKTVMLNYYPEEQTNQDPIDLMTQNLLRLKSHFNENTDENEQPSELPHEKVVIPSSRRQSQAVRHNEPEADPHNFQELNAVYQAFLESLPPQFNNMPYEEKLAHLIGRTETGSIIYLFELIYYFREALPQESLFRIADEIARGLDPNDSFDMQCRIELLALIGVSDQTTVHTLIQLLLDQNISLEAAFSYLVNIGPSGLHTLIDLANKDFQEIPLNILELLANSETIITDILVPTFFSQLLNHNFDARRRTQTLAILSRLYRCVTQPKDITVLARILEQGSLDRTGVASALKACGELGEDVLVKFLKTNISNKAKLPIISVLPWKVPFNLDLRIQVIDYSVDVGFTPGTMYIYEGSVEPAAFCQEQSESNDQLILNSRDFLAALNRYTNSLNSYQELEGETERQKFQESNGRTIRRRKLNCKPLFKLVQLVKARGEESEEQSMEVSPETVKALIYCLSNAVPQIREAALNALGVVGLPYAEEAVQKVAKCLYDSDSRNRSMACWALSKLCQDASQSPLKISKRLVELLKDSYWKVRTSACIALGAVTKSPSEFVIEALMRCLKDGSINRNTVCETMIRLGQIGEEILVEFLKCIHKSDFQKKLAIINSFKLADTSRPYIDFLIEEVLKQCRDDNVQVRALCLETLNHLRKKSAEDSNTYLKAKNILPVFYYFMEDQSQKLRELAVEAILSFGTQAELIFIQGLTKSPSPLVRAESAKGLCKLGAQNFRAIIFGLRDNDQRVRKATSTGILSNLNKYDIVEEFRKKPNQVPSLLCHIKDIMGGGYAYSVSLTNLMEDLLAEFQGEVETTKPKGKVPRFIRNKENQARYINQQ